MTQRINYGTGFIEVSAKMNAALSARALEQNETVGEALAAFATGEAEPEEYGLAESDDSDDSDDSE